MLNVLLSLAPIVVYLVVLRAFDAFSMIRWRTMGAWMGWGVTCALLVMGVVKWAHASGHAWSAPWVSPVLEETLKVMPLLFLVWRRKVVFTAESQLYGEAIGGGFAFVENILYLQHFTSMNAATALVRGFGTGLLHMGCTAILATLALLWLQCVSRFSESRQPSPGAQQATPDGGWSDHRSRMPQWLAAMAVALLLFLPSVGIHTLYNTAELPPMNLMIILIVVFFMIFYLVSRVGERTVIRWLDVSMDDDVRLISSLRQGRLAETKAGEYLSQLRTRFDPFVFFDMCVYVQLYLELLIEAKGRVMLRDAGLPVEESAEKKAERQARITELDAIANRIPRLGLQLLRPLIHATSQDQWVLRRE